MLEKLRQANFLRHIEWWKGKTASLLFRAVELGGEAGEVLNKVKKIERESLGMSGSRCTKEELAEELADVVICADLLAMDQGIDLSAAIKEKFNRTSTKLELKTKIEE